MVVRKCDCCKDVISDNDYFSIRIETSEIKNVDLCSDCFCRVKEYIQAGCPSIGFDLRFQK